MEQVRAKMKELRQGYVKTRERRKCSGAGPETCPYYQELDHILAGESLLPPPLWWTLGWNSLSSSTWSLSPSQRRWWGRSSHRRKRKRMMTTSRTVAPSPCPRNKSCQPGPSPRPLRRLGREPQPEQPGCRAQPHHRHSHHPESGEAADETGLGRS